MRFLSSSDWHKCHDRTPTPHIINNLRRWLYTDTDLDTVDVIFNAGDIFDHFVDKETSGFLQTIEFHNELFNKCKKHKVKVRIVEGTYSHDWGQIKHIMSLVNHEEMDVKYFTSIEIETFDDLDGLTVMYVPDNMSHKTPDEIWELALSVLAANNLKKVDLIILHGGFYFQLPEKGRKHAHMEERWESIARYGIFSGHIHIPGHNGNKIWSNGSFDRNRHGEEHPKGAWDVTLDLKKKVMIPTFYENKNALPYLTYDVSKTDLPEHIVLSMKRFVTAKPYPNSSQFRIRGGLKSVVDPIIQALTKEFPQFGFSEKSEVDDAIVEQELYKQSDYEGVVLNKDNLFGQVFPEIEARIVGTDITETELGDIMGEFL